MRITIDNAILVQNRLRSHYRSMEDADRRLQALCSTLTREQFSQYAQATPVNGVPALRDSLEEMDSPVRLALYYWDRSVHHSTEIDAICDAILEQRSETDEQPPHLDYKSPYETYRLGRRVEHKLAGARGTIHRAWLEGDPEQEEVLLEVKMDTSERLVKPASDWRLLD